MRELERREASQDEKLEYGTLLAWFPESGLFHGGILRVCDRVTRGREGDGALRKTSATGKVGELEGGLRFSIYRDLRMREGRTSREEGWMYDILPRQRLPSPTSHAKVGTYQSLEILSIPAGRQSKSVKWIDDLLAGYPPPFPSPPSHPW